MVVEEGMGVCVNGKGLDREWSTHVSCHKVFDRLLIVICSLPCSRTPSRYLMMFVLYMCLYKVRYIVVIGQSRLRQPLCYSLERSEANESVSCNSDSSLNHYILEIILMQCYNG